MVDPARARRLADRIREIVAATLKTQVKDPRLGFLTLTDVRVTPDLRDATVYYTVYGDSDAQAETAQALHSARGVLRAEVGRQTGIKFTPTLAFVADAVPETARHLEELLIEARRRDAAVQAAAAAAHPVGDPDPYRKPRDADVDVDAADSDEPDPVERPAVRTDG